MRHRRHVDDVKASSVAAPEGAADGEAEQKERRSYNAGEANGRYVHGLKMKNGEEIALSDKAFEDMDVQMERYFRDIDAVAKKKAMTETLVTVLKEQARRAARQGAILNSIVARAKEDRVYRRKIQEPGAAASLCQVEKMVEGFQMKLLQLMGEDVLHEAKIDKLKNDGKPASVSINFGSSLDKKKMRSSGGSDGG